MDLLRRSFLSFALLVAVSGLSSVPGVAEPAESITVASTTSTEQSGLFKELLPAFTQATGIGVKVVALGTGQALDAARRGDADVALVHDTAAEEKFVGEGWSTKRYPVMYNDFVIVGPKDDPAGAAGAGVVEALRKIAAAKAPFVSRGDRSGTHSAELRYWKEAGLDLGAVRGDWYKDVGQGWVRRSTLPRPPMPTCSATAARGCRSRTGATSRSWWKATSASSTNTA